jgi:hypothetical protein
MNNWELIRSDEFDGLTGSAPNISKWKYDLGGGGWGNNELEEYTMAKLRRVSKCPTVMGYGQHFGC